MTKKRTLFEDLEERILLSTVVVRVPVTVQHQPGNPATATIDLDQFDTQMGQVGKRELIGARLDLTLTSEGGGTALDYEGAGTGWAAVTVGTDFSLRRQGQPTWELSLQALESNLNPNIQPDEPGEVPDPDYAGVDSVSVTGTTSTDSGSIVWQGADLDDFIGGGVITFDYEAVPNNSTSDNLPGLVLTFTTAPSQFTVEGELIYTALETDYVTDVFDRQGGVTEELPPPTWVYQPMYSGTGEPGSTLTVSVYDVRGDLIGSETTVVDAGGNWFANFFKTFVRDEPHSIVLRQTYGGPGDVPEAGYNLRTYFVPAIQGGTFVSEYLTVENVLGKRETANAVNALYAAGYYSVTLGWHAYSFEFLSTPATASGI